MCRSGCRVTVEIGRRYVSFKVSPSGIFYAMGRHVESPPGLKILLVLISKNTIHLSHDIVDNPGHHRVFRNRRFYDFVNEGFVLFTEGTNRETG